MAIIDRIKPLGDINTLEGRTYPFLYNKIVDINSFMKL